MRRFILPVLVAIASFSAGLQAQNDIDPGYSFGRVKPTEPVAEVISFTNPTDSIIEIAEIETTPPLEAEILASTILPGLEGSFRLVLGSERTPGPYTGAVKVHFKDSLYPAFTITVGGFIIPPIEFQPYAAFYVATQKGKDRSQSIEILNHRDEPFFPRLLQSSNGRYSIELESIEDGRRYRLTLALDGNAEPGEQTDEFFIQADPPLEEPLKVQVNTKIRERVYHFPASVDMGALPQKVATDGNAVKPLSQILMVYRPDTDDFQVEASIDLDYIDMTVERGPQGDRYQMDLTLIPEKVKPGKIEGTVTIKTNDEEFPVLEVPVTGYILE